MTTSAPEQPIFAPDPYLVSTADREAWEASRSTEEYQARWKAFCTPPCAFSYEGVQADPADNASSIYYVAYRNPDNRANIMRAILLSWNGQITGNRSHEWRDIDDVPGNTLLRYENIIFGSKQEQDDRKWKLKSEEQDKKWEEEERRRKEDDEGGEEINDDKDEEEVDLREVEYFKLDGTARDEAEREEIWRKLRSMDVVDSAMGNKM